MQDKNFTITHHNAIAIIGVACHFPDATDLESYKSNLFARKNSIKKATSQILNSRFFGNETEISAGFLDNIDMFDPEYFHINPNDAHHIDPLARQILLLVPQAFHNSGYKVQDFAGKNVGVFIGSRIGNYSEYIKKYSKNSVSGLGQNFISAYTAQVFNFIGANMVIDTACSSSLVSIHLAMQSLNNNECDLAIAGGVDLLLDGKPFNLLKSAGALSQCMRCAPFDEAADGIVLGEGAGIVILKRLQDSMKDYDKIDAIILGSAVNNDGTTMGITTPNPSMQEAVIKAALSKAKITPYHYGYLETHGTGTQVGDPIELAALNRVFNSFERLHQKKCYVGSVKGNIGHLLSAAGIASFIKVILSLKSQKIIATINCNTPNPRFNFENSQLAIATQSLDFPKYQHVCYAGISAFGFGGTNAHLVLMDPYSLGNNPNKNSLPLINYNNKSYWIKETVIPLNAAISITDNDAVVSHHKVQGLSILPGVSYLSWLSGVTNVPLKLQNINFLKPLVVQHRIALQVFLECQGNKFQVYSTSTHGSVNSAQSIATTHVVADLNIIEDSTSFELIDINSHINNAIRTINFEDLYNYATSVGIVHDRFFKNTGVAYINTNSVLLEINPPNYPERIADSKFPWQIDAAVLDGATFAFVALFFEDFKAIEDTYIPIYVKEAYLMHPITYTGKYFALVNKIDNFKLTSQQQTYQHDVQILDSLGNTLVMLKNVVCKKINNNNFASNAINHLANNNHAMIAQWLQQLLYDVTIIQIDENLIDSNFFEMGLDSQHLLKMVKKLELLLNIELSPTLLFEHNNIATLTTYLLNLNNPFITKLLTESQIKCKNNTPINTTVVEDLNDNDIAIIGMYGEYGSFRGNLEFWQALCNRQNDIRKVDLERCNLWGIELDEANNYFGSWLPKIEYFDSLSYNISPKQAVAMDPQERKFLEAVKICVEESGYSPNNIAENTNIGVFVGVMYGQYELYEPQAFDGSIANSFFSSIANRISYVMDWHGPSIAIDTMCSGSVTAIHLACESIKNQSCKVAVVGGVNIASHVRKYDWLKANNFLLASDRCKSFGTKADAEEDGYVPGEGVGVLILKTLHDAKVAGDHIWGIIKGTAINHNGQTTGFTVPSVQAQSAVINAAIKRAGISKKDISYIEAHGTGTTLGDPIEIQGIAQAFKDSNAKLSIGSVKSNIGHLEAAAGIAGVTKVLLQMRYKKLVPSLHSEIVSPYINFEDFMKLQQDLTLWQPNSNKLIAGVSAFGAGGANAHIILQKYDNPEIDSKAIELLPGYLLLFSATSLSDLHEYLLAFKKWWQDVLDHAVLDPSVIMESLSWILATQRRHYQYRIAAIVKDHHHVITFLEQLLNNILHNDWWQGDFNEPQIYCGIINNNVSKYIAADSIELVDNIVNSVQYKTILREAAELYVKAKMLPKVFKRAKKRINVPALIHTSLKRKYWPAHKIQASGIQDALQIYYQREYGEYNKSSNCNNSKYIKPGDIKYLWLLGNGDNFLLLKNAVQKHGIAFTLADIDNLRNAILPSHIIIYYQESNNYDKFLEDLLKITMFLLNNKTTAIKLNIIFEYNLSKHEFWSGCYGLLKSLQLQKLDLKYQVIQLEQFDFSINVTKLLYICSLVDIEIDSQLLKLKSTDLIEPSYHLINDLPEHRLLRSNAHYIITGGLGNIGYKIAEFFVKNYQAKLTLIGKSALNSSKVKQLNYLKQLGGAVQYIRCDLKQISMTQSMLATAIANLGAINGIIHAAGDLNAVKFELDNLSVTALNQDVKILGALNLEELTKTYALDFFVVISSHSSVLGFITDPGYALANSLLDDFVKQRINAVNQGIGSGVSLAIQWPIWKTSNLNIASHMLQAYEAWNYEVNGIKFIDDPAALSAFDQIMAKGHSGIYFVANGNSQLINKKVVQLLKQDLIKSESISTLINSKVLTNINIKSFLVNSICNINKINTQDFKDNLTWVEYGFDSITLKEFSNIINLQYNLNITPAIFFEHHNLIALAEFLEQKINPLPLNPALTQFKHREYTNVSLKQEPIVVVGMDAVLPKSPNLTTFWQNIIANNNLITTIPASRWKYQEYLHLIDEFLQDAMQWGGFIDNVASFDADFFNCTPTEAVTMDPQQRLMLQSCLRLFNNCGLAPSFLKNKKVGVFIGAQFNDYYALLRNCQNYGPYRSTGNASAFIANRLSYVFDLRGPSEVIDTACSSSMVAVHRAMQSIRAGECEFVIAGGVSLILDPIIFMDAVRLGVLSKQGFCNVFDMAADGYVRSEGVASILLTTKEIADKYHLNKHVCLKHSAVNHGGKAASLTAPNPQAQIELLTNLYNEANVNINTLGYLEAHGTGTQLGDSIEVQSIIECFNNMKTMHNGYDHKCIVSSVKSRIGHLEPASGIVGLITAILAIKNRLIPGVLHFNELNKYVDIANTPIYIGAKHHNWETLYNHNGTPIPRRAGVSSFGFGGVNAHMLIEEII